MATTLPYPTIVPVQESPAHAQGWLRDVIWGTQVPHLIATGERPQAWRTMDLPGLAQTLGPATRANLMVSATGVVGYYNTGLVAVTLRDGRVWGHASVSRLQPQEEIELPHVQIAGNLGAYAEYFRDRKPDAHFIGPHEHVYVRTCENILPAVRDVMAHGIPTDPETLEGVSVYLSQTGTVTNLHWDLLSGAMQQLRGRKQVVMFPPSEIAKLPMYPVDHIFARRSLINGPLDEAALAKHDVLAQVRGVVCNIGPGDWLYLPAGWLHHVTTLDDACISLIINFRK